MPVEEMGEFRKCSLLLLGYYGLLSSLPESMHPFTLLRIVSVHEPPNSFIRREGNEGRKGKRLREGKKTF